MDGSTRGRLRAYIGYAVVLFENTLTDGTVHTGTVKI